MTAYDVEHEKRMHLIVVRRDTAGFQHVHPELGDGGIWSVPLTIADAGDLSAIPRFPARGQGPHRRIHRHRLTRGPDLNHYEQSFMNARS